MINEKMTYEKYPNTTALNPALDEAKETLKQANELACRVVALADRLCGMQPVPEGDDMEDRPDGDLKRFRQDLRDTRQTIGFAAEALTRIQQELVG